MICQKELKELFDYNALTGHLIRKTGARKGQRVGCLRKDGRRSLKLYGKSVYEHHVIWIWMTGQRPVEVDHRNLMRGDNRWNNLRECSRSQNNANRRVQPNNLAGSKGINLMKNGLYRVRIMWKGRRLVDRIFTDMPSAQEFHSKQSQKIFGEFARDG